jgi:hypothetical protein
MEKEETEIGEGMTRRSTDPLRIQFGLNPKEGHGYETERLWGEPLGNDEFRILNSPFFVFGVSSEDVVKARAQGDDYHFEKVVRRGGHSTYRIFLQKRTIHDPQFKEYWNELAKLGCTFENANDRLLVVDVPPGADVSEVYGALQRGEAEGIWVFEEGHYAGRVAQAQ